MPVDLPPDPQPSSSQSRSAFVAAMAAVVDWFYVAIPQLRAALTAMNFNSTNGTSSTSVTIGTGSKSFTASTSKSWVVGMTLKLANSSTNWMIGELTSYDTGTGALVMNIRRVMGSGTYASWTISLAASEPEGSWVFLGSVSASASAQVDIENDFDDYDVYRIVGTGIYYDVATTMALRMRFKISGSYDTANNYQNSTVGYIELVSDFAAVGANLGFAIEIYAPALARAKIVTGIVHQYAGAGGGVITGNHSGTGPLTGVRFYPSANTITGGKFALYGLKNA